VLVSLVGQEARPCHSRTPLSARQIPGATRHTARPTTSAPHLRCGRRLPPPSRARPTSIPRSEGASAGGSSVRAGPWAGAAGAGSGRQGARTAGRPHGAANMTFMSVNGSQSRAGPAAKAAAPVGAVPSG